ncbi:DUF3152 domain-containing protein [Cellulomonas soli]|uniref:DUF3152 domain-containing protein n=1 Tax=Cellulomonas soli TaxID=931535 RepID=UPI0015C796D5|nr:DUF3152 domain-containing protein [Cellulomonas soli]
MTSAAAPSGDQPEVCARSRRRDRRARPRARSRARRPRPVVVSVVAAGLVAGAGAGAWASGHPGRSAVLDSVVLAVGSGAPTLGGSSGDPTVGADALRDEDVSRSTARTPLPPTPVTVPSDLTEVAVEGANPTALPAGLTPEDLAAGLLSAVVTEQGTGTTTVVPGSDAGPGTGAVRTVRVEVEDGLAVDAQKFADTVMTTLNDPRGWGGDGSMSFARTDGAAELTVVLASPTLVDVMCAPLDTNGQVSCGTNGHAVLNLRRWVEATAEQTGQKTAYRQYLVNHEVGHLLGHGHEACPGPGMTSPVMQQQSYKAAPCIPNGWPFP